MAREKDIEEKDENDASEEELQGVGSNNEAEELADPNPESDPTPDYEESESSEDEARREHEKKIDADLSNLPQNASSAEMYRVLSDHNDIAIRKDRDTHGRISTVFHGSDIIKRPKPEGDNEELQDLIREKVFSVDVPNEEADKDNQDDNA